MYKPKLYKYKKAPSPRKAGEKKPRENKEHDEQVALFKWWASEYPEYYDLMFSIPNGAFLGGKTQKARATNMNNLKAEGLLPGVSDIFLMMARGGYHGLFLELKAPLMTYSKVSIPQREHIARAIEQGYHADWCAGEMCARDLIIRYLNGEV